VRNNSIYTTASTGINNFNPLFYIFIYIYTRNPFNLNFVPLNCSIKNILTFINFILSNFASQTTLSLCSWLITAYNWPLITTYKSVSKLSTILVSSHPDIVATDDDTAALSGIVLNLSCLLWLNSKYITDICSLYHGDILIRLGNIDKHILSKY